MPADTPDMVLVPREPTDEMIEAGEKALAGHTDRYLDGSEVVGVGAVQAIYEAMLSASPLGASGEGALRASPFVPTEQAGGPVVVLPDPCSHLTGWDVKWLNGAWRVGMRGNLDVWHDAAVTVHTHTTNDEAKKIADWIAATYNAALSAPSTTSTAEQVDVPRDEQGRDAYQIIADCNREAMMRRAGTKDRSRDPLLGPPNDMAVSRVLLAERPDLDPNEADRLAVKINDALSALAAPNPPGEGEAPVARVDNAARGGIVWMHSGLYLKTGTPLYTRPTPATPEGLREAIERLSELADSIRDRDEGMFTIRSIRADRAMLDIRTVLAALQPQAQGGE